MNNQDYIRQLDAIVELAVQGLLRSTDCTDEPSARLIVGAMTIPQVCREVGAKETRDGFVFPPGKGGDEFLEQLPVKPITYYKVYRSDVERTIKRTYGRPLDVRVSNYLVSDEVLSLTVPTYTLAETDPNRIKEFVENGWHSEYTLQALLNDMYEKGIMPEGQYLIAP